MFIFDIAFQDQNSNQNGLNTFHVDTIRKYVFFKS